MSGQPRALPPPSSAHLLPVLVAVTYLASVVAVSGFLSLGLDRDVIDYPDAGPFLGIAMVLASGVVTWLGCRRAISRLQPWGGAVLTALAAFGTMVVVGAIGYSLVKGDATWLVLATARFATSPFTVAAAVLAGLAVVGAWALARAGRPAG